MRRSAEDALGIISGSVDLKEFSDYRLNFEGVKRALASKIHIGAHVLWTVSEEKSSQRQL